MMDIALLSTRSASPDPFVRVYNILIKFFLRITQHTTKNSFPIWNPQGEFRRDFLESVVYISVSDPYTFDTDQNNG